jgi:hypothetical protein
MMQLVMEMSGKRLFVFVVWKAHCPSAAVNAVGTRDIGEDRERITVRENVKRIQHP